MASTPPAPVLAEDQTFGPQLRGHFDFTLLFQHAILTLLPSALLIVSCPAYMYCHTQRTAVSDAGWLLWAKLVTAVALIGTELAGAVLWSNAKSHGSNMAIIASSVACVGMAAVLVMIFFEHRHSYRPSSLLATFLILTMLFDIVKARTHFTRTRLTAVAVLCVVAIFLKCTLMALGELPKRSLIRDPKKKDCSDETVSGFWNRSLFLWLNKMFIIGFNRNLEIRDLPELEPEFNSELLHDQLQSTWKNGMFGYPPLFLLIYSFLVTLI